MSVVLFIILFIASIKTLSYTEPADPVTFEFAGRTFKLYNYIEGEGAGVDYAESKEIGIDYVVDENKDSYYSDLWWSIKVGKRINLKRLVKAVRSVVNNC